MKANISAVFIILLTSASMTVAATPYSPYYQGGHQGMQPPAQPGSAAAILEEGVKKLTTYIRSKNPQDRARAIQYLKSEIAPYFDFTYMTQWAAGPAWRNMDAAQRSKMEGELAKSFLTILATNLSSYNNQQIRFFTPRGQRQGEKTVSAWIMEQDSYPTKLDFRFYRNKQGSWKIFDVKVAGNSAVSYYRNMFRQQLRYSQARASR
jgi:phospholipid transport system substrate-binding protein